MNNNHLDSLIAAWLDGRMTETESEALQQMLRESADSRVTFRDFCELDAALREVADSTDLVAMGDFSLSQLSTSVTALAPIGQPSAIKASWPVLLVMSALLALAALGVIFWSQPGHEPTIATVTGLSGPLRWTGDGGQVLHELTVGTELGGGTIDGISLESWCELEFDDGSWVTISGNAMLAFSDLGQKELHLKNGTISANVTAQPQGKPMLIHTRSAELTVLGTSFEVEAGLAATALQVTEGEVGVERSSDGATISVPAMYRVVVAADRPFVRERVSESIDYWNSQLHLGPGGSDGLWLPASDGRPATLEAIPFVPRRHRGRILHLAGVPLSQSERSRVVLKPNSRFVVRGRLTSAATVYFGFRVTDYRGKVAGKFVARSKTEIEPSDRFEVEFELSEFRLNPNVWSQERQLSTRPEGLFLAGVWCFTRTDDPKGLAISEVELVPPRVLD